MKVTESVEKMRVKERFINSQHDGLREEYQQVSAGWRAITPRQATGWLVAQGLVGVLTLNFSGETLSSTYVDGEKILRVDGGM